MQRKISKHIPLLKQEGALKSFFPNAWVKRKGESEIHWVGEVKPTPLSATYTLYLRYKKGDEAEVFVVSPSPLPLAKGKKRLPHVYNHAKQRLCLYYPVEKEWDSSKYYVKSLIPWACEWLMHYEIWVATGNWKGGGIEHEEDAFEWNKIVYTN